MNKSVVIGAIGAILFMCFTVSLAFLVAYPDNGERVLADVFGADFARWMYE